MADDAFQLVMEINGRDFYNAGQSSAQIKQVLKEIGVRPEIIRRVSIAAYEAEMNVVMYARRGTLVFTVTPRDVQLLIEDEGPGIESIELAMREGYSTASEEYRRMGFGAGMGLPNIKKNADEFELSSVVGQGTRLRVGIGIDVRGGNG